MKELPTCAAKGCSNQADPRYSIHTADKRYTAMVCDGHGNPGCNACPCTCVTVKPEVSLAKMRQRMNRKDGIRSALADVGEFHKAIPDSTIQDRGQHAPALVRRSMRHRLLREEFDELTDAMLENDLVEVADAYADMIYILLGSAIMHIGSERFARVWDEVQRSNMAKLVDGKIVMREDGKVLKPDGWTPPDVRGALGR